ncbi:histidine kinase [Salibacterium salarium]|uniref:Signal transduction histidine-protein kinase/phosphatase DegS n=1 Tax=Salibacterium salarium TaxID=284579 RepID=A0A428MV08_9BACI|nr:sensor histidine kinase [Salibacterium salarium]RSL29947.1 histidine kinase [Salibacterium salarium]
MSTKHSLDEIIDKMLDTVGDSKEQIFDISERSRQEYESLQQELKDIREKVANVIDKSESTEMKARFARNRLAEVSRHFQNYSDDEVKKAYEQANELQVELAVLQQEEKQLRERRDNVERRLLQLEGTIERAEALVSQVSVVYNFLAGDLKQVGEMMEEAKEKQQFGLKIIEAQEKERKRVAREIHDGPAQMIANVMLRSELVERVRNEKGMDKALEEIQDLRSMIRDSLAEVRRIIYDLRPMALDDLGLIPTLNKYLKNVEEQTNLTIRFNHMGKDIRLPANLEVGLFRLVQEAVQNAYKHADPSEVQVKIEMKRSHVSIVIKDDGKGFDTTNTSEDSFGLMGMRERINALEGDLTIDSAPRKGTVVMIQVSIDEPVE